LRRHATELPGGRRVRKIGSVAVAVAVHGADRANRRP
jgi:hypothetical protein